MTPTVDYPHEVGLIDRVARYLYAEPHPDDEVSVSEIQAALPDYNIALIDRIVERFSDKAIVLFNRRRDTVSLTGRGKEYYSLECIPEVTLGLAFCHWRYARAVVHVIVPGTEGGENAGTGFFVDDPPDHVVTNRHVVAQGRVIRINDINGEQLCDETAQVVFGPENLDLALIHCTTPPTTLPLRIDWNLHAATVLEEVLILGYPRVALHHPTLFTATGQVSMYASQYYARESLVLTSRVAAPGCSGGPVIGSRGLVVGVVMGDSIAEATGSFPETMLCTVPSHYVRELLPIR